MRSSNQDTSMPIISLNFFLENNNKIKSDKMGLKEKFA